MYAAWQSERVRRAKDQDIFCTEVDCIDDGFVFTIVGTTGEEYLVEIYEDAGLWCQNRKAARAMTFIGGRT